MRKPKADMIFDRGIKGEPQIVSLLTTELAIPFGGSGQVLHFHVLFEVLIIDSSERSWLIVACYFAK